MADQEPGSSSTRMYLCFNTKSGDFVRLPFTGLQDFILTKEFLDVVATEDIPIPGFPKIAEQYKRLWVEVEYRDPEVKAENILQLSPEESLDELEELARKTGWIK